MDDFPDLENLSVGEKDQWIRELWPLHALVRDLLAQVTALQWKVTELEARLAINSRNSSKPPSSDGLVKPKPQSLRKRGERPTGGQKGHKGPALKQVAEPDRIVRHSPPSHCEACYRPLPEASVVESRQGFDRPPLRFEVTEHRVLASRCACGQIGRGDFPAGISSLVPYGPAAMAAAVRLTHHHMMPVQRTAARMGNFFGLPMAEATVLAACEEARSRLQATVDSIGAALPLAEVVHADETGLRVAGSLHWMHVLATATLTWVGRHAKRGREAFDAFAILPHFAGTLLHDGWKPYREWLCQHGLCNVHPLRELTYVFEELGQAWAGRMIPWLADACQEANAGGGPLPAQLRQRCLAFRHRSPRPLHQQPRRTSRSHAQGQTENLRMLQNQERCRYLLYPPLLPRHPVQAGHQSLPRPSPDFPKQPPSATLRLNLAVSSA